MAEEPGPEGAYAAPPGPGGGAAARGARQAATPAARPVLFAAESVAGGSVVEPRPQRRRGPRRRDGFCRALARAARESPWLLALAGAAALLLAAVSVCGVALAMTSEAQYRRDAAQGLADRTAAGVEAVLAQLAAPLLALSVLVQEQPSAAYQAARLPAMAPQLLASAGGSPDPSSGPAGLVNLRLAPQGVLRAVWPPAPGLLGADMLADPLRAPAARDAVQRRGLAVQGPLLLQPEGFWGVLLTLPIFLGNASGSPAGAKGGGAGQFWGFAVAAVRVGGGGARPQDSPLLQALTQQGYGYVLTAPQPGGGPPVVIPDPSGGRLAGPVSAPIRLPGGAGEWTLQLAPASGGGWAPAWAGALLALACVTSAALGLVLFGLAVSRHQQSCLVAELQAANEALSTANKQNEALASRQMHLIRILTDNRADDAINGSDDVAAGGGGKGGGAPAEPRACVTPLVAAEAGAADTPLAARNRIEELRRAVGAGAGSGASAGEDNLQLMELLGQGAFGRVYRGLWRGTVVAVKTMTLPPTSSGTRERMAIIEAAISTAMAHPNIVQTYTYHIKPLALARNSSLSESDPGITNSGLLKGFEVWLVLEYMELGSLRDALDANAFALPDGSLNYAAVLDTAADVARAMLHLHKQQVLHSDLKARNVLLKSDGKGGRGAVAKVADFGLSLQMDAHVTHVSEAMQGTPSHMAPEVITQQRLSKAADVYSFGVLLWELLTARHAHKGVPPALLGHRVSVEGQRPPLPSSTPQGFRELIMACWASLPDDRPTFDQILPRLVALRRQLGGRTPPLRPYGAMAPSGSLAALVPPPPQPQRMRGGHIAEYALDSHTFDLERADVSPRPAAPNGRLPSFRERLFGTGPSPPHAAEGGALLTPEGGVAGHDGGDGAGDSGFVMAFATSFFDRRRRWRAAAAAAAAAREAPDEAACPAPDGAAPAPPVRPPANASEVATTVFEATFTPAPLEAAGGGGGAHPQAAAQRGGGAEPEERQASGSHVYYLPI